MARKTGKSAPKEETSAEAFVRLGKGRMTKSIRQIRTLRSLSHYEHSKEQTQRIAAALTKEVEAVIAALNAPVGKAEAADLFDF